MSLVSLPIELVSRDSTSFYLRNKYVMCLKKIRDINDCLFFLLKLVHVLSRTRLWIWTNSTTHDLAGIKVCDVRCSKDEFGLC